MAVAKNRYIKGFSTLEIVIALAVMSITLTSVAIVSFGSQSFLSGSQTNADAMNKAQRLIEVAQAQARKDFHLVNPIATTTEDIYQLSLDVRFPSTTDHYTKQVTALVSWTSERGILDSTKLTTLLTNFENAIGGDTCHSVVSGNWQAPTVSFASTLGATFGGTPGSYRVTDIDAYQGKLYVTSNYTSLNKETFFVFGLTNPLLPVYQGKLDNDPGLNGGLAAVAVAEHISDGKVYAYVASASSFHKGQMQVIDVTNPTAPTVARLFKIATSTVPLGTSGQGIGNSITYKNGYVYLGLTKAAAGGKEFHIIDVHNPLAPMYVGGYAVGNGVNHILVRGSYAYISSPNTQELLVLDISNPALPTLAGGYNAPNGTGNGQATAMLGDNLYLARENAGYEISILDNRVPTSTSLLGSYDVGSAASESVYGLIIRNNLLFALTNGTFSVINVSSSTMPVLWSTPILLPGAATAKGSSLDCEGNILYAGTHGDTTPGSIFVISAP